MQGSGIAASTNNVSHSGLEDEIFDDSKNVLRDVGLLSTQEGFAEARRCTQWGELSPIRSR